MANAEHLGIIHQQGVWNKWREQNPAEKPDLSGADLRGAKLKLADLNGAKLNLAELCGADLNGAKLELADLSCADLSGADLRGANLSGARLSWANLKWAHLSGADLRGADLRGADLFHAHPRGADLRFARLADLLNWSSIISMKLANIHGVIDAPEGFVVWAIEKGAVSVESTEEWEAMRDPDVIFLEVKVAEKK